PARAFAGRKTLGRVAVIANGRGTGVREHKTNRTLLLFQEVRDEARCPGEDRYTLHGQERIPRIEQYRAYRTGNVHHQWFAQDLRNLFFDRPCDLDVATRDAALRRYGE